LDKVKKQGAVVDQINAFIKNMMWFLPLLLIIIPPAIYLFDKTMTKANFMPTFFWRPPSEPIPRSI
jgi:hypothetical protein